MISNGNEILSKSALITKLEQISKLYNNVVAIRAEMENIEPEDNYRREIVVPQFPGNYRAEEERQIWVNNLDHTSANALKVAEMAYQGGYEPKEPKEPKFGEFQDPTDTTKPQIGCLPFGAGFVAFVALIGMTGGDKLGMIISCILLAICIPILVSTYLKHAKEKEEIKQAQLRALAEYNRKKRAAIKQYNIDMATYEKDLADFPQKVKDFLAAYSDWRQVYLASLQEEARIHEKLEADKAILVNNIYETKYLPAKAQLDSHNNLVTEEYLPALGVLIQLLKRGRADNLKEAINLYEEILYRERQLEIQREQENQRRMEEERRYQEEKEFREQQEYQRRREEERREKEAERRHKEDMLLREKQERDRQAEERRKENEERRRQDQERRRQDQERRRQDQERRSQELSRKIAERNQIQSQCSNCALSTRCGMAFSRPNCASYRPK